MVGFSHLLLGLVVCMNEISGDDEATLTTAMVRDHTSPKPTALHRRINVESDNKGIQTVAVLDLFQLNDKELRRSRANVWNWDYWCQLQPKVGNCSKFNTRYYYDAQLDQCRTFKYSGCHGNKNQFDTLKSCETYCKGATYMQNQATDSICSLQPNAGLCMAMFNKYYFDVNEGRCKSFIFGGCGGNHNRFNTMSECKEVCRQENADAFTF